MPKYKLSERDRLAAQDALDRFDGKAPYDVPQNITRGDGYFVLSLEEKYGMTLEELRRAVQWPGGVMANGQPCLNETNDAAVERRLLARKAKP